MADTSPKLKKSEMAPFRQLSQKTAEFFSPETAKSSATASPTGLEAEESGAIEFTNVLSFGWWETSAVVKVSQRNLKRLASTITIKSRFHPP